MNKKTLSKNIRKWHRKLGLLIGIQLLLWSLGGVIFSWIHIDNVRGDYESVPEEPISFNSDSTLYPLAELFQVSKLEEEYEVKLGYLLAVPVYRLYQNEDEVEIYDAYSGRLLSPIDEETALRIAENDFLSGYEIKDVEIVNEKAGEYKKSVPAYKISVEHWKNPHIYIHANSGVITARRNSLWRLFDFFWMLHIMDYNERTDFNNLLIKGFSLFGVLTVSTGFTLFFLTTPIFRKRINKNGRI